MTNDNNCAASHKKSFLNELCSPAFLAGAVGGLVASGTTQPVDTIKTRIQLTGKEYNYSMKICATSIVKKEGFSALWKGLSGPMASMIFINGLVFMVEDVTLDQMNFYFKSKPEDNFILKHSAAGAVAGLVQSVIACPFELAKCRLQMDGKGARTSSSKYRFGAFSMLNEIRKYDRLKMTIRGSKTPKYLSVFRGMIPTIFREVPSFAAYFGTYFGLVNLGIEYLGFREPDSLDMIFTRHFAMSLVFGGLAGCACWLVSYPFDVIKTKIQMDGIRGQHKYKGMWHCGRQIYATEGPKGLFRGFNATMIRAFFVNAITFATTMVVKSGMEKYFDEKKLKNQKQLN